VGKPVAVWAEDGGNQSLIFGTKRYLRRRNELRKYLPTSNWERAKTKLEDRDKN
jgi:hypothetical protein